ncbi:MAG TPA: hypothetical protein VF988_08045 [Verrucomicrobiae bacterium]
MKTSFLIKCAAIGVGLPLLAGCVEREVVYRDRPGPAVVEEEIPAPPPPQTEIITVAPGPPVLWFWAPGYWEWHGHWVWVRGHWMHRPHPGAIWIGPHWDMRGHHRVWIQGYWR